MEKALEHLESPEKAAEQVLENMLSSDRLVLPSDRWLFSVICKPYKLFLYPTESYVVSCSDNVIEDIQNKLQDVRNPMAAIMVLLRELDLETDSEVGGEGPAALGMSVSILVT